MTDQNNVGIKHLPDTVTFTKSVSSKVSVSDILPLKEASDLVEKQLLSLAKEKYGTTMKIAEALGVNQSTISRKLNKLDI
jgi:transcriptional regulator with PAS, ATPase and Fis domain